MFDVLDRILIDPNLQNRLERTRARTIYIAVILMVVSYAFYELFVGTRSAGESAAESWTRGFQGLSLFLVCGGTIVALIALRLGYITLGAYATIAIWCGSGVLYGVRDAFYGSLYGINLLLLVILCLVTLRRAGLIVGLVLAMGAIVIAYERRAFIAPLPIPADPTRDVVVLVNQILGGGLALAFYIRNLTVAQEQTMTRINEERIRLATITTDIARRIASRTNLDELLSATVEEIRTRYTDIYHAQIFLVDTGLNSARLAASTGEIGQVLMGRGHNLAVGSVSVIGQVTLNGTSVVARAGSSDTVHRRNELLPETVVEAAFPLLLRGQVIGALDLQSRDIESFSDDELPIFQSLADNIAVAIENARLFEQTEARLRENQRLLEQMRGAMREIERLNRQMTGRSWSEFLGDGAITPNLDIDFAASLVQPGREWTDTLREAAQNNHTVQGSSGGATIIALPIRVRGQVIGAMEFELDGSSPILESVDLAQTVGERFGLALENTRLYQETQRSAQRDQRVNAISTQYQTVTTVDELLRITLTELGDLLGADRASIRLSGAAVDAKADTVANLRAIDAGQASNGHRNGSDGVNGKTKS